MNVGVEIFGKGKRFTRPVLVFKKFSTDSFLGIPLTSQSKQGSWYIPIRLIGVEASVILNQARTLDRKRLAERMGTLGDEALLRVKQGFIGFYGS